MPNKKQNTIWEELREKLADIEHQRWSDWQRYLHNKCVKQDGGNLVIVRSLVLYWERQIKTSYKDLSEAEKDSDREQVDRYLPLIKQEIESILGRLEEEKSVKLRRTRLESPELIYKVMSEAKFYNLAVRKLHSKLKDEREQL